MIFFNLYKNRPHYMIEDTEAYRVEPKITLHARVCTGAHVGFKNSNPGGLTRESAFSTTAE